MSNSPASDRFDWSRFDAMTDAEVHEAALADPDAQPLTDEDLKRMKHTPKARIIRMRLKLSQEAFAERFRIPVGTLRDWEQGRKVPDAATRAYLTVIARDPEAVAKALATALPTPQISPASGELGSAYIRRGMRPAR